MAKRSNITFIVLWITCGGLAILAGGFGRTLQGEPFFARYSSLAQNIFYAGGVAIFGLVVGWLGAKLVQRLLEKRGG